MSIVHKFHRYRLSEQKWSDVLNKSFILNLVQVFGHNKRGQLLSIWLLNNIAFFSTNQKVVLIDFDLRGNSKRVNFFSGLCLRGIVN